MWWLLICFKMSNTRRRVFSCFIIWSFSIAQCWLPNFLPVFVVERSPALTETAKAFGRWWRNCWLYWCSKSKRVMRCFAEKSVLAEQKKSSSGSRVLSSQATAENHCLKPHEAPGCGTAPACMNTSSDSIRKPWRIHTGFKFSLAETQSLFLTLWLTWTYPDQKDPYLLCSVTATPWNKPWCQAG